VRRKIPHAYASNPIAGSGRTISLQGPGPPALKPFHHIKLTEADYRKAVQDGGFTGTIIVGTDLASLRLPAK